MSMFAIAIIAVAWVAASVHMNRARKSHLAVFQAWANDMAQEALRVRKDSLERFEKLTAKFDSMARRRLAGRGPLGDRSKAKFLVLSDVVAYTKRRIVTYYDVETGRCFAIQTGAQLVSGGEGQLIEEMWGCPQRKHSQALEEKVLTQLDLTTKLTAVTAARVSQIEGRLQRYER